MDVQGGQDNAQTHIALLKVGNSSHDLLVSGVAAGFLQLDSQVSQFLGMSGIVADHVLHQRNQLLQRGVLAVTATAAAAAAAIVVMVMMMVMLVVMAVQMLMVMMVMAMVVVVVMCVVVAVGMTVVGMLMGVMMLVAVLVAAAAAIMVVMMVVVIVMHSDRSFDIFFLLYRNKNFCQ